VIADHSPNRRRASRHTVRMLCQAVRERDFTLLGEVALDLSPDGMLLRSSGRVLTGEPVIVSFFEPHVGRWFDVQASVARVVHARRPTDSGRCVALQFDAIPDADRLGLFDALHARETVFD
jgi:hypothetical protein